MDANLRSFIEQLPEGFAYYEPQQPIDLSLPPEEILKLYFQMTCIDCNAAYTRMHGFTREEIIGIRIYQLVSNNQTNLDHIKAFINNRDQNIHRIDLEESTKSGQIKYFSIDFMHNIDKGFLYRAWVRKIDQTERQSTKNKLHEQETIYHDIFKTVSDDLFMIEVTPEHRFRFITINPSSQKNLNVTQNDVAGHFIEDVINEPLASTIIERLQVCLKENKVVYMEKQTDFSHGQRFMSVSLFPIYNHFNQIYRIIGIARDITEAKEHEMQLNRLNWALTAISHSNAALLHSKTELELFQACCDALTSSTAYPLAFITKIKQENNNIMNIVAANSSLINLKDYPALWGNINIENTYTKLAIDTGTTEHHRIKQDNLVFPLQQLPILKQLVSIVIVPLKIENNVFGTLNFFADDPIAFSKQEIKLCEEVARNLCFGIKTLRTAQAYNEEIKKSLHQALRIQQTFESSLSAIAHTVECRDPYTAGHQRRVADLAAAIAKELQLDPIRIQWLRLAATVHDIGKIQIPTEILTKPARLTPIEFELIKTHPQVGYEILKDVDFPAPIATIVRQHHEYLDGTGYPQGLKSDEILLDSQILTVADIVESMSSHRPYRPALSLETTLDYIQDLRGIKLSPQAVDACCTLFQKKNYQFIPSNNTKQK